MKAKLLVLSVTLAALSGCSLFGEKVAEEVARAIDDYCKEPQQARELYRAQVNEQLADKGHEIIVSCNGDLPE